MNIARRITTDVLLWFAALQVWQLLVIAVRYAMSRLALGRSRMVTP